MRTRHIVGSIIAIIVAIGCVRLGIWQLDRLQEKRTRNLELEQRGQMPPLTNEGLISLVATDPGSATYRRVRLSGSYDVAGEGLLFGRGRGEEPGHQVLTPLILDVDHAVLVDRGAVPEEMDSPPVIQAPPPDGEVTVTGVVLPPESSGGTPIDDPIVTRVDVGQLQPFTDILLLDAWVQQTPSDGTPAPGIAPRSLPEPQPIAPLDEGPHLGYAVQWFIFAVIAIVGWVVLVRRDLRDARTPAASSSTGH